MKCPQHQPWIVRRIFYRFSKTFFQSGCIFGGKIISVGLVATRPLHACFLDVVRFFKGNLPGLGPGSNCSSRKVLVLRDYLEPDGPSTYDPLHGGMSCCVTNPIQNATLLARG